MSSKKNSHLEYTLYHQICLAQLPRPYWQYKFHPTRKWLLDFAWPDKKLIVEVEGGVWTKGRHTRPQGFMNDCEKYNEATLMGYYLLRVVDKHIQSGKALNWIELFLKNS